MLSDAFPFFRSVSPLGPARMVASFFLLSFTYLRLTVGRVSEFLIRILPHGLSDALV